MNEFHGSASSAKASKARTGFYIHMAAFVLVNALLVGINLTKNPDRLWALWPLLGWGVGIAAHGVAVFTRMGRRSRP